MPTALKRPRTAEEASSFKRPLSCLLAVETASPLVPNNNRPSSMPISRILSAPSESDETPELSSVYVDASDLLNVDADAGVSSPESLLLSPQPRCDPFPFP
jgi:hypothetical protein